MSQQRRPPQIESAALRDNAGGARVERIWKRLESNLVPPRKAPKRSWSVAWAPALAAGLTLGFVVGRESVAPELPPPGRLVAEPAAAEPAGPPDQRSNAEQSPARKPEQAEARGLRQPPRTPRALPSADAALTYSDVPVAPTAAAPLVRAPAPAPSPALWLQLADRGDYERASQALEEQGGFDWVLTQASADELMVLVDVARATGNRGRAIQALRRVTESFVSNPNAPIAAMTLGRMLMQSGDRKGASEAFSLYRRLSPEGDFAEDALASDIQAAVEEGDWERAQTLAKQYETDFPDGRHLEQIREQLNTAVPADGSTVPAAPDAGAAEPPAGAGYDRDATEVLPPEDSPY
ncbi:MAG TPA: hypothetical protein VI197_06525 [Polyangiaceae bacterium]